MTGKQEEQLFKLLTDRFDKSKLNLDGYSCSNANRFESI